MRAFVCLPLVAACATPSSPSIEPTPSDGAAERFVIDDVSFPTTEDEAKAAGSDLDGDGVVDNAIGIAIEGLLYFGDVRDDASVRTLIGQGAVPSSIEIFGANGDADDSVVGLAYLGRQTDERSVLRGTMLGSAGFATDGLEATTTTLLLPAFLDVEPTAIDLAFAQYQLVPDASGFELGIQGMAEPTQTASAACTSILQMIAADPDAHEQLLEDLGGRNGIVTIADCLASNVIRTLLSPDVTGPDRQSYVSIGIDVHVSAPRNVPPFE